MNQYDYFGIDSNLHESLVFLNWLYNIICIFPYALQYDDSLVDKFVYDVVKIMK